jgi:integrase
MIIMASIKQYVTASGLTRYRVTVNAGIDPKTGKRKNVVRSVKTEKEATLAAARLELQAAQGDLNNSKPHEYTFDEVYQEWWANYANTVRPSTAFKTERIFSNHILPAFGQYRVARITTRDIQKQVAKWFENTEVAYQQRFIYTNKLLNYAERVGYLDKNPAANVVLPRKTDQVEKDVKYWNKEQVARFFECIDPRANLEIYLMMWLLVYTGIRREELLALRYGDVDFTEGTLSVNRALVQGKGGKQSIQPTKSKAGKRTIPIGEKTVALLKQWRQQQHQIGNVVSMRALSGNAPLFPGRNRDTGLLSLNTPNRRLHAIIDKYGLTPEISLHSLRKSFITNMEQADVPIATAARLAGHSDPAVTLKVYSGMDKKAARDGIDKLTNYLS